MKSCSLKLLSIFLFFIGFSNAVTAQDITGIWRGYFVTESNDQYKFEVQVEQNKNNRVSGVSYSYLSTVFYGKASLTGYYNKSSKTALIQEIKTIELRMSGGSVACIMKCLVNYARSGNEEFLEGTFTSSYEKSDTGTGIRRGGNCGGGKIYLRKVTTSDFYVEPFLRDKPLEKNTTPPVAQKPETQAPAKKPNPKQPSKSTAGKITSITHQKTIAKTPKKNIPETDTARRQIAPPVTIEQQPQKELPKPSVTPPAVIRNRQNNLLQTINVKSHEVVINLYDNGEIDGDTISVYFDNKLILSKQGLTASPLTATLNMGDDNSEHTLTMVADNLGRIPPNTSLMIVHDGDKRYEVRVTSDETKNATVRFRYQKTD